MSARNLRKAEDYREEVVARRRVAFYSRIRDETEAWRRRSKLTSRKAVVPLKVD